MKVVHWGVALLLFGLSSQGIAGPKRKAASDANKKAAQEYCKVYEKKYKDKECKVDVRVCPKGWRADKKFKGKGTNYSACVRGKKSERTKQVLGNLGTRNANKGSAELVNTDNCSAEGIEYVNESVRFLRTSWSAIRREAERPTRSENIGYEGSAVKPISVSERKWKKVKSRVDGNFKVYCSEDPNRCQSGTLSTLGYDTSKRRYITLCANNLWVGKAPEDALEATGFVLLHEMAHDGNFPMDKLNKHNCRKKWANNCPFSDETYQLGHAARTVYERSPIKKTMTRRKSKARRSKRRFVKKVHK